MNSSDTPLTPVRTLLPPEVKARIAGLGVLQVEFAAGPSFVVRQHRTLRPARPLPPRRRLAGALPRHLARGGRAAGGRLGALVHPRRLQRPRSATTAA